MFTRIDLATWPRREHFQYYRTALRCGYTVTVRLDITAFRKNLAQEGLRFYPSLVYAVARCLEDHPAYRMGVDDQGNPGYYDVMHPVYTIFHADDHTFTDLWSEYHRDFPTFYQGMLSDLATYGDHHGIKARKDMPPNFFCISCVPWLDFTGYATSASGGDPNLFPVMMFGKFTQEGDRWTLPFAVNIAHAAADGWHTAEFFRDLQTRLDTMPLSLVPEEGGR